jgi:hypothetical protein
MLVAIYCHPEDNELLPKILIMMLSHPGYRTSIIPITIQEDYEDQKT